MLSPKTHGLYDYAIGIALVLSPYIGGFANVDAARTLFLVAGFGLIIYSLLTRYYYSIAKVIPLGVHMCLDAAAGVVVMLAPWLFDYNEALTGGQTAWHVILGAGTVALVLVTKPKHDTIATSHMAHGGVTR
jgi:hypothetical protein